MVDLQNNKVLFISGIGTNVGKSFATGWLAKNLMAKGINVMTQKMIQTGNKNFSEDIDIHRKIMQIPYADVDNDNTTAPVILSYPASPHLAATIDKCDIDLNKIKNATRNLSSKYDLILLEGAGGLMVPIKDQYLTIDYICENNYPVVLVINGILGSINHAILSLEALQSRNISLKYIIYNSYFDEDAIIAEDTRNYLKKYFSIKSPESDFLIMPKLDI